MILSRTMRPTDEMEIADAGKLLIQVHEAIQMWYSAQHKCRTWEYALAVEALWKVFGEKKPLKVSDHGCGAGFLSPMLYWLGHDVTMYECWTFGNEEKYMMEQMRKVGVARGPNAGTYEMRGTPLCLLGEADKGFDAAFCISTLEHIGEYQKAFRDLLGSVKDGGLVFITTDFAEDEEDHYLYSHLRAGKMFTDRTYHELLEIGQEMGFSTVGNQTDWIWNDGCKLIYDEYGFGSLALVKG